MMFIFGIGLVFIPTATMADEDVKFALIYPQSGPLGGMGQRLVKGGQLAVMEINEAGGIKAMGGAKLKAMVYDTESKPNIGQAKAESAIAAGNVALIGALQSSVTLLTTRVAEKKKVPHIVPVSVASAILQDKKFVFRIHTSDVMGLTDIIKFVAYLGKKGGKPIKTLAILHDSSAYGQKVSNGIKKLAPRLGMEVVMAMGHEVTVPDLGPQVAKVKTVSPDFIIGITYPKDAITLARAMKEQKCDIQIYYGAGAGTEEFVNALGEDAEFALCSRSWSADMDFPGLDKARLKAVSDRYKKIHGIDMNFYSALVFSSVYVLKDALERAGSTNGQALRDAIATTDLTPETGGYITAHERIRFNEAGQNPYAIVMGGQVLNGKIQIVWPEQNATGKLVYPVPPWDKR